MPELIYQVAALLVAGGAIYGGIRADLRTQRESIAWAHRRIDDHLSKGHS